MCMVMASNPNQSDKLGMLDNDDTSISPQNRSSQTIVLEIDYAIRVL